MNTFSPIWILVEEKINPPLKGRRKVGEMIFCFPRRGGENTLFSCKAELLLSKIDIIF